MSENNSEFFVYKTVIDLFIKNGWTIICASPPGGTDSRFRKCLFPRREKDDKGPRDEVDVIAYNGEIVVLIECKQKLSWSFQNQNNQNESDYQKLKRIMRTLGPANISLLLQQATGIKIINEPIVMSALAVNDSDYEIPSDVSVFSFGREQKLSLLEPLKGIFD